jgi:hypothetical protein
MPKKPPTAMQAFMTEQAKAGKGAALPELQKRFITLPEEEKKRLLAENDERQAQYKKDMDAFEKSKEGRQYLSQTKAFGKRKKIKDLREKFMKEEPKRPPSAYFCFLSGTQAKVRADYPDLKGLGPVQAKLSELWKGLSEEERQKWLDIEKEKKAEYDKKLQESHNSDDFKKYRRFSANVLKPSMGKAKAKKGPVIVAPVKPANMPVDPKNGFSLFSEERRRAGGDISLKAVAGAWTELKADGQKKYMDQAEESKRKYEADMLQFQKTVEGKKYLREKAATDRKQRLATAKKKYLGGAEAPKEPKRPPGPYFLFLTEKSASMSGTKARGAAAKDVIAMWSNLNAEEKQIYEDKARVLKEKYDVEMAAYKGTAGYKAYEKTMNNVTGKAAKVAAQIKAKKVAMLKVKEAKVAKVAKVARTDPSAAKPAAAGAAPKASGADSDAMGSDSSSSSSSSSSSD